MGWGGMAKGGVPDRWEDYSNNGTLVDGTQFVPFKVPLKEELLKKVKPGVEKWGLEQLIETLPQLGLVVDLTNTSRYYQCRKLEEMGVQYCKIFTKGHEIPDKGVVEKFYEAVESMAEDKVIGVHCTHGLNRTGYLVCRYMVEKKGIEPEAAIQAFDLARGHKQERANYLQHLRDKAWESEPCGEASDRGEEEGYEGRSDRGRDGFKEKRGRWSRNRGYRHDYPDHTVGSQDSRYEHDEQQQYHEHQQDYYDSHYQGQWERRGDGYGYGHRGSHQEYNGSWGRAGFRGHQWNRGHYQYNRDQYYERGWHSGYYDKGASGGNHTSHDHRGSSGYQNDGDYHPGGGENSSHGSTKRNFRTPHNNPPVENDMSQTSRPGKSGGVPGDGMTASKKSKWKKRSERKKKKKLIQTEGIFS